MSSFFIFLIAQTSSLWYSTIYTFLRSWWNMLRDCVVSFSIRLWWEVDKEACRDKRRKNVWEVRWSLEVDEQKFISNSAVGSCVDSFTMQNDLSDPKLLSLMWLRIISIVRFSLLLQFFVRSCILSGCQNE